MEPGTRSPLRAPDSPAGARAATKIRSRFAGPGRLIGSHGEVVGVPRSDCVVLSRSGTPTTSPTAQFEELDFRWREHPDRHAYDADPPAHVQLTVSALKVPHHVLGDQTSRRPRSEEHTSELQSQF